MTLLLWFLLVVSLLLTALFALTWWQSAFPRFVFHSTPPRASFGWEIAVCLAIAAGSAFLLTR